MTLLEVQPVVLISGISAAGKSTVAEGLASRFPRGVHVKGDVFRRMVVAGRQEMTAEPSEGARRQLHLRYRLGAATADEYHREGFSVVVQDVILGPELELYAGWITAGPLVVVVLAPRPEVVARRERDRPKVAYRPGAPGIVQLDAGLRSETPRLGLWLDTSDQTPEQTIEEIIARGLVEGQIA